VKLRYEINDDASHYLEANIDLPSKQASFVYVNGGKTVLSTSTGIADVLDMEKTKSPQVQIAKRGYIWDLHIYKVDINANEIRKTISIVTPVVVVSTKARFINDTTKDVTMKDYVTHPLDVYSSRLTLVEKTFADIDGLIGQSGNTSTTPVVTPDGMLELGNKSVIQIPIASDVDLSSTGFTLVLDVTELGNNDVSNDYQLGIKFGASGSNMLKFDSGKGITLSTASMPDTIVAPPTVWGSNLDIMLSYTGTEATLHVNGTSVPLGNFKKDEIVDSLILTSMCNDDKTTRVNYLLMQKLKG